MLRIIAAACLFLTLMTSSAQAEAGALAEASGRLLFGVHHERSERVSLMRSWYNSLRSNVMETQRYLDIPKTVSRAGVFSALVLLLSVQGVGTVQAQDSQSGPLARELTAAMTQKGLNAYAVRDPGAADTFVAALLFPGVQLLVVSGRPTVAAAAEAQLDQRQYADVYALLHEAVVPETKFFVQDLNADGLHSKVRDTADIVYEHVTDQLVFDGAPEKRHVTQDKYDQQFAAADRQYSRLLAALIGGLKITEPTAGA